MSVSPLANSSAYLGQSLIYDRPVVLQDGPGAAGVFPSATPVAPADLTTLGSSANAAVTQKIEEIADNPNLTDKQKRAQINDLRKQLGLSKGDMKKYFTKPLEQAYAQKIDQLKASGIDTPQKQQLLEQLESKKNLYHSMYKTGGCVKKVFKGIGKGLEIVGKVALGVASVMYNPLSLIPLIGQIPGVGKAVDAVSGAISKATDYVNGALNQVSSWVDQGMGYVQKGIQFSKDVVSNFGGFDGLD